jgi:hypothetical protein
MVKMNCEVLMTLPWIEKILNVFPSLNSKQTLKGITLVIIYMDNLQNCQALESIL